MHSMNASLSGFSTIEQEAVTEFLRSCTVPFRA
jgi:hypothetical protein